MEIPDRLPTFEIFSESSSSKIKHSDLPQDMQIFLFETLEDAGIDVEDIDNMEYNVVSIPLDLLPIIPFNRGDRGLQHVQKMVGKDLPPIIISGNNIIDGRHRIRAKKIEANKRGLSGTDMKAIDLTKLVKVTGNHPQIKNRNQIEKFKSKGWEDIEIKLDYYKSVMDKAPAKYKFALGILDTIRNKQSGWASPRQKEVLDNAMRGYPDPKQYHFKN